VKIGFVGAGGVGSYYGGILARAGHDITLLARGAHLDALRTRGIEVRTPEETFTARVAATDDPHGVDPVEYAVVAVKNYSLDEVAPVVRDFAESGAVIVPLLNGVDVVDRLTGQGVPRDSILGGLTAISAVRVGPGCVERRTSYQRVVVGELPGGSSPRAEKIASAFREAGAEAEVAADITLEVWRKFAFIASAAAACGLARSPIAPLRETPLGRLLLERAVREVVGVARARGVAFGPDDEAGVLRFLDAQPASMKPSLLLDLEAGRPTEIDHLSGTIARLARQTGLATPIHDTAAAALGVAPPLQ
jgi:2-dehydropantoate 2-reductase